MAEELTKRKQDRTKLRLQSSDNKKRQREAMSMMWDHTELWKGGKCPQVGAVAAEQEFLMQARRAAICLKSPDSEEEPENHGSLN